MKSVNTWFASVSIYSIVVALVLFEFSIPAFAQSISPSRTSHFSDQQLDDLQEFARQFRQDSSLQPPVESTVGPPPVSNARTNRVPAYGASFALPRQDKDQSAQDQIFDPFSDLRPKDEPPADKSILDPAPDPPLDEKPNQAQNPREQLPQNRLPADPRPGDQDQSNPFSDDRAVDNLREPQSTRQPSPNTTRRPNATKRMPEENPVDEAAIRQWEMPPDAVMPKDNSQNYPRQPQSMPSTQRRQPRSSVEPFSLPQNPDTYQQNPYPYDPTQPNQLQQENRQPDYWAQPNQSNQSNGHSPQPPQSRPADRHHVHPNQVQPGMQAYDMNGVSNGYSQAGQSNYFAAPNQPVDHQWGVAGDLGCNGCGISDCGFDCDALEFYLAGYGALVDLRNLISGSNTLFTEDGGGWGVALGRIQGQNLRTELEYGWRANNIIGFDEDGLMSDMNGKVKSQAGMANAYWEFVNFPTRTIKPYVGAGIGFARFDVDLQDEFGVSLTPERSKDSSFAYQFMGGINYQPFSTVDLFIEYRLFRTDSFQIDTSTGFASGKYNYEASNLVGGLRWKF